MKYEYMTPKISKYIVKFDFVLINIIFILKGDKRVEYSFNKISKVGNDRVEYSFNQISKIGGERVEYSFGKPTKVGSKRI